MAPTTNVTSSSTNAEDIKNHKTLEVLLKICCKRRNTLPVMTYYTVQTHQQFPCHFNSLLTSSETLYIFTPYGRMIFNNERRKKIMLKAGTTSNHVSETMFYIIHKL
jgi:hypothetical protein